MDPQLTSGARYADPLLRLPGADDPEMYKLLPGSTAKSNGSTIAAGQDFFGFSVAGESAPHIGAYNGNETFGAPAVPTKTSPLALLLLLSLCAVGAIGARPKCLR